MKIFVIICLIILNSCVSEFETNDFVSLASLIDKSEKCQKPCLIYLNMPDCALCELFNYKILADKKVRSFIHDHFLFYKIDITQNKLFNRLFQFYGAPVLLVLEQREIKNIISNIKDGSNLLYILNNYRMIPLETSISSYTSLKGTGKELGNVVNQILNVLYLKEKGELPGKEIRKILEESVKYYPCFYNQYLLSETMKNSDPEGAKQMLARLFDEYSDSLIKILFANELQSMLDDRFHLEKGAKSKIEFEHLKYDFGEVRQGESVSHKFFFKNVSLVPLLIYSVSTSCGCTVPKWSQSPVLNGMRDSLEVVYTPVAPGKNMKTINVITNAEKRNVLLTITAMVK